MAYGSLSIHILFVGNIYVLTTFALNNIFCDRQMIISSHLIYTLLYIYIRDNMIIFDC